MEEQAWLRIVLVWAPVALGVMSISSVVRNLIINHTAKKAVMNLLMGAPLPPEHTKEVLAEIGRVPVDVYIRDPHLSHAIQRYLSSTIRWLEGDSTKGAEPAPKGKLLRVGDQTFVVMRTKPEVQQLLIVKPPVPISGKSERLLFDTLRPIGGILSAKPEKLVVLLRDDTDLEEVRKSILKVCPECTVDLKYGRVGRIKIIPDPSRWDDGPRSFKVRLPKGPSRNANSELVRRELPTLGERQNPRKRLGDKHRQENENNRPDSQ